MKHPNVSVQNSKVSTRPEPRADMRYLGFHLNSSSSHEEIAIVGVLARVNPRVFWEHAGRLVYSGQDSGSTLRNFCANDPRLARLALRACARNVDRSGYRTVEALVHALSICFALPGQRDSWYLARAKYALPFMESASAGTFFDAIGAAARLGRLDAALALVARFPDAQGSASEARRHTFGNMSYASRSFGDESSRAWECARLEAAKTGVNTGRLPPSRPGVSENEAGSEALRRQPKNTLFWLMARSDSLALDNPVDSKAWIGIAAQLITRGVNVEDSDASLAATLGHATLRRSLILRRPKLGRPSFHGSGRSLVLFKALSSAPSSDVAEIVAYDETSEASQPTPARGSEPSADPVVHPLPAAAIALLAGHAADPAWMPQDGRVFKIKKALIKRAADGTLGSKEFESLCYGGQGRGINTQCLSDTLNQLKTHKRAVPLAVVPSRVKPHRVVLPGFNFNLH